MNGMYRLVLQDPSSRGVVIIVAAILLLAAHPHCARSQPNNTPAAAAGDAETAPRGQRVARDIRYGDWRKYCFKPAGTKPLCRTTITGTFETGQTAIRLDLIERDGDGGSRLQLFLPVGMYLQAGVKLAVDQGNPYRIPYTWCLSNACIAADLADPKFIAEMERGQALALEVVDTNVLTITTSLPLGSFASVRQGAATQTFDQNIDE